ncbi:MRC1-like domain-containing protein [Microdochium trichocladiopsis]|uniref:MRC1-like domain-containing protein n=1 Tax=Microdochium trichocladiopsis TaxID=1682393 RepID=A0A9P9BK03_9PEZI|nr:MRC1-like domain-containing protein [Microdochium trichocladiopsis]KAH7026124.1 MRC1-like domain-containing protein [Microdochium trichocladiopsis]
MTSPRSGSPAGDAPQSPTQLSPRSKIQAMLAAVDDSSDEDQQPHSRPNRAALFKTAMQKSSTPTTRADNDDKSSAESSEEEEQIIRPRGRMAARMHAGVQSKSPEQATESSTTDAHDEVSQEVQTLPRRRIRAARNRTPEPAAATDAPSSPGLFVTPSPQRPAAARSDDEDELDEPQNLAKNDRFLALVARKRQEREAKEREEAQKQEERARRMAEQSKSDKSDGEEDDDVSDIDDDAGGLKLTQQASRPARKAGKKAMEEMNRETQRLARSLQLAHEAKTRKKITKASLFERFNFRVQPEAPAEAAAPVELPPNTSSRPSSPTSPQQTDVEMADEDTPPSSPPDAKKTTEEPTVEVSNPAKAPASEVPNAPQQAQSKGKAPQRQVRVKMPPVPANLVTVDSDDELEIVSAKPNTIDKILKKLPAKKDECSTSMTALMRLANLSSPPKGPGRGRRAVPSISATELQTSLVQKAREQAKLERDRRLEELRAKGIHIQTDEERERQREEIEDIVAKARQEVEEIMQREREESKKERKEKKANGELDPLAWDDSDDDSYDGSDDGEVDDAEEVELSGSDEEGDEDESIASDDEGANEAETNAGENGAHGSAALFEVQAQEDAEEEDESVDTLLQTPAPKSRRSRKNVQIVSDDEDGEVDATPKPKSAVPESPARQSVESPQVPTSVLRSATKTFIPGLPVAAARPAGLGLTQMFAGTMDDTQDGGPASGSPPIEFLPSFDNFPDSQFSATAEQAEDGNMVLNSQPTQEATLNRGETQTQEVQLHFSQSQIHGFDSLIPEGSQMSEALDLTQDGGYQELSPLKQRFIEPPQSTIETVLDGNATVDGVPESPLVKRRGKLMRRVQLIAPGSTIPPTEALPSREATPATSATVGGISAIDAAAAADEDAFKRMEKAARRQKRLQARFDRRKSRATEMVEEQAEESEDEYAGLGGADGEDSSEEDEELAKMMIDDTAGNDADEQQLAGLHAERARAADAAQVDKLFRDITTGMLRKRRRGGGNDFDLSDSDDDGEARRRMKRRQFAKMQKALFADERIGKIAENPRNSAFMKSIEDRDSEDDWDFDDNFADEHAEEESQSQEPTGTDSDAVPDSQSKLVATSQSLNLGRKRSRMDDHSTRTASVTKRVRARGEERASSLAEVQRSLSSLLEEPNASIIPATDFGSDSEGEEQTSTASLNKENRTLHGYTKASVVDRIALKRGGSNASNNSNSSRLAFASAASATGGFKVPALLRRATTNSLMSSSSTSTVAGSISGSNNASGKQQNGGKAAGFGEEAKLKKNAGKKSGVNYFARETERRAAVAEKEKKREAKKLKGVEGRAGVVGGLFGKGSFE